MYYQEATVTNLCNNIEHLGVVSQQTRYMLETLETCNLRDFHMFSTLCVCSIYTTMRLTRQNDIVIAHKATWLCQSARQVSIKTPTTRKKIRPTCDVGITLLTLSNVDKTSNELLCCQRSNHIDQTWITLEVEPKSSFPSFIFSLFICEYSSESINSCLI